MFIIDTEKTVTYIDYKPAYKGFNVTEFGSERREGSKNKQSDPHHRYNYILHFVTEGTGNFLCNGKNYKLYPGRAFVITPKDLVDYRPDKNGFCTYCWLAFSGSDCDAVYKQCGFNALPRPVFDYTPDVIEPLNEYLSIVREKKSEIQSKTFALSVLSMCYEVLTRCSGILKPEFGEKKASPSSIVDSAIEYMQNNLDKQFNVSSLCHELGVSRAHFTTLFTKTMHQSPYKYLVNLRIQQAAELLISDKNLFVYTIAELVGFSSVEQFCKTFYKLNDGVTPTEFRERYLNSAEHNN